MYFLVRNTLAQVTKVTNNGENELRFITASSFDSEVKGAGKRM